MYVTKTQSNHLLIHQVIWQMVSKICRVQIRHHSLVPIMAREKVSPFRSFGDSSSRLISWRFKALPCFMNSGFMYDMMIVWPEVMYDAAEFHFQQLTNFSRYCKENWLCKALSRTMPKTVFEFIVLTRNYNFFSSKG